MLRQCSRVTQKMLGRCQEDAKQCAPDMAYLDQKFRIQIFFFFIYSYATSAFTVRICKEKHLLTDFPLNFQLTIAMKSTHHGHLAGTD